MVTVNLHPEGKGYLVYGDERIEEDTLLPRVTSITDILDKFGLRNYKMEQALEFVGDTLKENRNVDIDALVEAAKVAADAKSDDAANFGVEAHALLEQLAVDPMIAVPDKFLPVVEAWKECIEGLVIKETESKVYYSIGGIQFAGTVDMVASDGEHLYIYDYKTGKNVYAEHALQVAAYVMAYEFTNKLRDGTIKGAYIIKLPKEESDKTLIKGLDNLEMHKEAFLNLCCIKQWKSNRKKWLKFKPVVRV